MNAAASASVSGRLAPLRGRIDAVRRRRGMVRWLAAASTLVVAVAVLIAVLFLADWAWMPPVPGRIGLLAAAGVAVVAFSRRAVWPWLAVRESEADVALDIERRQGIDSDVIAALEFERAPQSAGLGSAALRDAVVAKVAAAADELSVPADVPRAVLGRRLAWAAAAVALLVAAAAWKPDHARAFVARMLLASARYPTRTRIEQLTVGGQEIDPQAAGDREIRMRIGSPLDVDVALAGVVPEDCVLELVPGGGTPSRVAMSAHPGGAGGFNAAVPRLPETLDVRVIAGDTWSDPVRVRAVEAPLVDLQFSARAPDYANPDGVIERLPRGARQVVVLEGAEVRLDVQCSNKRLQSATLVVDGADYPLVPASGAPGDWTLPEQGHPLTAVSAPVRCEVRVVDEDGLGPDVPLAATIRTRPDGAPRVTAEVQTRLVLPTGSPRVAWWASDDHGLARVELVLESIPAGAGTPTERESTTVAVPLVATEGTWLGPDRLPVEGRNTAPLAQLGLRKGDQVRVSVRVTDHRGTVAGRTVESDPVVLDVTDEGGILAALSEADQRSAGQLDAIIERELSAGGAP